MFSSFVSLNSESLGTTSATENSGQVVFTASCLEDKSSGVPLQLDSWEFHSWLSCLPNVSLQSSLEQQNVEREFLFYSLSEPPEFHL